MPDATIVSVTLWLAGNADMEKKMETTIQWYIGTTVEICSFIPSC